MESNIHAIRKSPVIFICACLLTLIPPSTSAAKEEQSEALSIMEKIARNNLGREVSFNFRPRMLGREVSFNFRPRMLGMTGIRLENFRIGESEQYLKDHPYLGPWAFSSESVDVRYNPFAIFIGRISLSEVNVLNPQVQISVNSRFKNNFEDIMEKQKANRFSNWIRAHDINIKNMDWNIYSELIFAQPIKYEVNDIDVHIQNVIKGKIASIDIAAKTPGATQQNVSIVGSIGPILSIERIEESPMNIQYRVDNAPLDFELANIPDSIFQNKHYRRTLALPESGLANMSYNLEGDVWKKLDVVGVIDLDNIVLASIDKSLKGKAFNIHIASNTTVSLNEQRVNFDKVSIAINQSTIDLQGSINSIIDNPQANLQLNSNTIDLAEFNNIYPFVSDIYKIKLIKGTTNLNLVASGNLKEGLALNGQLKTTGIQLADINNKRKGKALNSSINLSQAIIFYAEKNQVVFEAIDLQIANSNIKIEGTVDNATLLNRTLNANIQSEALDISAMHEFAPFFDAYLPDELKYSGYFSFAAKINTSDMEGQITGKANFSRLNFSIKNFARKTQTSRFDVDYFAGFDEQNEFQASAAFVLEKGELDNSTVYISALRYLLGGGNINAQGLAYLSAINPEAIKFARGSGNLSMKNTQEIQLELSIQNIQNQKQKNVDLKLSGLIGVENYEMDLKGELHIPKTSYQEIVSINPQAKEFVTSDGAYLVLPLNISGTISKPVFKAQD